MDKMIDLVRNLLKFIQMGYLSKQNVYKLVFIEYLSKRYNILINCKFDDFQSFIQYLKKEISTKNCTQDEFELLNQCLNDLTYDFKSSKNELEQIISLIDKYSMETYLKLIKFNSENFIEKHDYDIPKTLSQLVLKILNTKKEGKLADLICGNGEFLVNAIEIDSNISVLGLTQNKHTLLNSKIRLHMLNSNYAVIYEKDLNIKDYFNQYDSVFCLLPPNTKDENACYHNFINLKNKNYVWKYIDSAIDMINPKGKIVFILNNAPLFRTTDLEFRKYLIDHKLVETIIELPNNILYHTGIETTMLVLSKNNNMVSLIDATEMYTTESRLRKTIDVDKIFNEYIKKENKVTRLDIKNHNYSFIPSNYLNNIKEVMHNPVRLGDYTEVFRGFRGSKGKNSEETIKVIQVSNLNTDFIDVNNLDDVNYDRTMDKSLLKDKDIIFPRVSSNFYCKILRLKENEKVIASENLLILRVKDLKLLSPYYLQEYLNSDIGQKSIFANQLKSIATIIQINKLNEAYIDLISMHKQLEIEKLSIEKYNTMKENKAKLESFNDSISKLLNEI